MVFAICTCQQTDVTPANWKASFCCAELRAKLPVSKDGSMSFYGYEDSLHHPVSGMLRSPETCRIEAVYQSPSACASSNTHRHTHTDICSFPHSEFFGLCENFVCQKSYAIYTLSRKQNESQDVNSRFPVFSYCWQIPMCRPYCVLRRKHVTKYFFSGKLFAERKDRCTESTADLSVQCCVTKFHSDSSPYFTGNWRPWRHKIKQIS